MNERTCCVCRKKFQKAELLRIVKNKNGEIRLDISGKAEGRGAYVCKNAECVQNLIKKRGVNRAFKTEAGAEIYSELGKYIESENLHRLCDKG